MRPHSVKSWAGLIAALVTFILPSPSHAGEGGSVGHGGNVVLVGGKYHAFDLFEAGIHDKPYLDSVLMPQYALKPQITEIFSEQRFPMPALAFHQKMRELMSVDPSAGSVIALALSMYRWTLVEGALAPIVIEDTSLEIRDRMRSGDIKVYQAAVRQGSTIRVNRELWNHLDPLNQAALMFHETLYALLPLENNPDGSHFQPGVRARELVARLFTRPLTIFESPLRTQIAGQPLMPYEGVDIQAVALKLRQPKSLSRIEYQPAIIVSGDGIAAERVWGNFVKSDALLTMPSEAAMKETPLNGPIQRLCLLHEAVGAGKPLLIERRARQFGLTLTQYLTRDSVSWVSLVPLAPPESAKLASGGATSFMPSSVAACAIELTQAIQSATRDYAESFADAGGPVRETQSGDRDFKTQLIWSN